MTENEARLANPAAFQSPSGKRAATQTTMAGAEGEADDGAAPSLAALGLVLAFGDERDPRWRAAFVDRR